MKTFFVLTAIVSVLFFSADLLAQIIPNYNPTPGAGQRVLTNAEINVVDAAIHWWHVSHPDVGPINIDFLFDAAVDPLAVTTGFTEDGSGRPISSLIRFSDQPAAFTWYVDPTPLVNEPGEVPNNQWDMLSTTSHEIAHAIGFTRFYTPFAAQIGAAFPDGRRPYNCTAAPPTSATLVPQANGTHVDPGTHPGDLMVPALTDATRRIQSGLDIGMIACPFGYAVDNAPVADAGPDQTVECASPTGALVMLDGTGSNDPDGDAITYTWSATGIVFDDDTAPMPTAEFPTGATTVTLTVSDGIFDDVDDVVITVEDTTPPDITCPGDVTVECVAFCGVPRDDSQLNGFFAGVSATDVCCGDADITDDAPDCFPVGGTTVTFTAEDCFGNQSTCTAEVTVVDTTPPDITVALDRDVLWPPNHKMADIVATVEVSDICCEIPTFVLTSITSNEPDNGKGDGYTTDDIQGAGYGTSDTAFQLRSERSGGGDGRVYTVLYTATDCSGNTMDASAEVRVPHDHDGWAFASAGFEPGRFGFDPSVEQFVLVVRSKPAVYEDDGNGNDVLVSEAFDATALDVTETYVGNVKGVLLPIEILEVDNDADGLTDLALYYSAPRVNHLIAESTPVGEDKLKKEKGYGPIGLHYVSPGGEDCLVPDIFDLGEPVALIPTIGVGRSDDSDTRVQETPNETALLPVHPNPFNPTTTIRFNLTAYEHVSLAVYDARGKLVRTLKNEGVPAGLHSVVWDGRDNSGRQATTGVYFVRLVAGGHEMTGKAVMIK